LVKGVRRGAHAGDDFGVGRRHPNSI
jgi:hypothetical protein